MTRIDDTFARLRAEGKKAFVTYVMAGDPDEGKALEIVKGLPAAGVDIIELGLPFTDPMADGPAIQASSLRALENGMDVKGVIDMVRTFRTQNDTTPIILMGYFNPIYNYGCTSFVKDAADAGVDGLIIVDLPPEEDEELRIPAQEAGLDFIKLVTPTTKGERLNTVLNNASGFIYYVSIAGVTGTKSADTAAVGAHIQEIKAQTDIPVAVGFGIKTPEDAANMAKICDGVVVGSAIVDNMLQNKASKDMADIISQQVRALKDAI